MLLAGFVVPIVSGTKTDAKKKGKKKKKKCKPEATTQTCAGTCGSVQNNCKNAVDCGACVTPCTGLKPTDNLQAAIDAALPGDTVTLCAGTWNVTQTISITKNIILRGAGIDQTILDGGNATGVIKAQGATTTVVRIEDLTVTRGKSQGLGGGIFLSLYPTAVAFLRSVAVTACVGADGGGVYLGSGTLTLTGGTRITGNSTNNQFGGNGLGGGVNTQSGQVILEAGCSVTGNVATNGGGGIRAGLPTGITLQPGSTVSGNSPDNCLPDTGACI